MACGTLEVKLILSFRRSYTKHRVVQNNLGECLQEGQGQCVKITRNWQGYLGVSGCAVRAEASVSTNQWFGMKDGAPV
jgi:hypothetical protein